MEVPSFAKCALKDGCVWPGWNFVDVSAPAAHVEILLNNINNFIAIATRHDNRDDNFLASVQLASIRIWPRHNELVA